MGKIEGGKEREQAGEENRKSKRESARARESESERGRESQRVRERAREIQRHRLNNTAETDTCADDAADAVADAAMSNEFLFCAFWSGGTNT